MRFEIGMMTCLGFTLHMVFVAVNMVSGKVCTYIYCLFLLEALVYFDCFVNRCIWIFFTSWSVLFI